MKFWRDTRFLRPFWNIKRYFKRDFPLTIYYNKGVIFEIFWKRTTALLSVTLI